MSKPTPGRRRELPPVLGQGVGPGALAGLVGGLVFGAATLKLGMISTIASVVRSDSAVIGLVVHLAIAAVVGAIFGLLVWHQRAGAGDTVLWGLTYGAFWWFLGPLTLLPVLLGRPPDWHVAEAQVQFPSLLGHLLYGASTGLTYALIRRADLGRLSIGTLTRGIAAGLLAAWLLAAVLGAQHHPLAVTMRAQNGDITAVASATVLLGMIAGAAYALLFPRVFETAGATLLKGTAYGFLFWVVGALTLLPLVEGAAPAWSAAQARGAFFTLPGYILYGAALALFDRWLASVGRILFTDAVGDDEEGGVGPRALRAVAWGTLAGLVGGLLFTFVMLQIGFLSTVSRLVGSRSPLTGFVVHLGISIVVGVSYGLLFRRQSYDAGSALGWGAAYGFFWWILGGITLLPLWLGGAPQWSAAGAAAAFPSLVGHLAYGAVLGVTFFWLEARYSPWWVSRKQAEAALALRREEHLRSYAPAVWTLVLLIALTIPLTLAGGGGRG